MNQEAPDKDPRLIWKNQRKEQTTMSIEEVRIRAREVHAKIRRNLIAASVLGLALLALCILAIATTRNLPLRVLTAVLAVQTIVFAYSGYRRSWPVHMLAPDAALHGCVSFYRQELMAQYRSLALSWCFLVPIVVFLFMTWDHIFETQGGFPRNLLPGALIVILLYRRYEARKLKRKLAALSAFDTNAVQ